GQLVGEVLELVGRLALGLGTLLGLRRLLRLVERLVGRLLFLLGLVAAAYLLRLLGDPLLGLLLFGSRRLVGLLFGLLLGLLGHFGLLASEPVGLVGFRLSALHLLSEVVERLRGLLHLLLRLGRSRLLLGRLLGLAGRFLRLGLALRRLRGLELLRLAGD